MNDIAVKLIGRIGVAVKKNRERFWDAHDYFTRQGPRQGLREALIFFRTRGCKHDAKGGCTMCDYSAGPETSADEMVDSVRRALAELPAGLDAVLVSPSGSLLDTWEVPAVARDGILQLLSDSPIPRVAFETRAETLDAASTARCREILGGKSVRVYVGLESADTWVSKYAINKALDPSAFRLAMQVLNEQSMCGVANILLGAPFLDPRESIEDTVATARWALDNGAREVCLFPCHVKRWTQVHVLHENGLYDPPSLWSMVEVLHRLGEGLADRIELAWLTALGAFNVVASPDVCPCCLDRVLGGLGGFSASGCWSDLDSLWDITCDCRQAWRQSLDSPVDPTARVRRAIQAYQACGEATMGQWWSENGTQVIAALAGHLKGHEPNLGPDAQASVEGRVE